MDTFLAGRCHLDFAVQPEWYQLRPADPRTVSARTIHGPRKLNKITPDPDRYTARWWHMCIQGAVLAMVLLTGPNIPRADAGLLLLLALSSVFYFFAAGKGRDGFAGLQKERWLWAVLLGFSLYLPLNALWAPNPQAALLKAATFILVFLFAILLAATFRRQRDGEIARIGKVIVWAGVIGAALAGFEFVAGHPLREAIYTAWPFTRPGDNEITVYALKEGELVPVLESEFRRRLEQVRIVIDPSGNNRNATMVMLLAWPLLLLAANQTGLFARRAAVLAIGGASALAVVFSSSQTAQIALVLSMAAFLAASFLPRLTHNVIVGLWCIATLLAVPLAAAPYALNLHKADWIFFTARDRISIWGYTARQVPKAPVFGTGIRSTRVLSKKLLKTLRREPGDTAPPVRLGRHSHNHYLQIWYELGGVGAVLFLLAGLVILRKLRVMAPGVRPYAYAGFVAACGIAAFGWGLWQTWLLAGYSLSAILLAFAARFAATRR